MYLVRQIANELIRLIEAYQNVNVVDEYVNPSVLLSLKWFSSRLYLVLEVGCSFLI